MEFNILSIRQEEIYMSTDVNAIKETIESGRAILGIELGSTRIKAVLIDENHAPIAAGGHEWENRYDDGLWSYSLEDIWSGLQDCYQKLKNEVKETYGIRLKKFRSIGFSAMMHGYLAFDQDDSLLVPFRTWRNTISGQAAQQLSELFDYNIPQRWSIAHLYQAILNKEEHVKDVSFFTTLSGYVHWMLTGRKVLGIGDASGMFPIDIGKGVFDQKMIGKFDTLVASQNVGWKLTDLLPQVLLAGEAAGTLTAEGAKLLDPSGELEAGIMMCAPEGDAGTGMAATNSVAKRTGNVSAGTSIFAMIVLEKELRKRYPEIDLVTTPDGKLVAMVHCNNCTSDLNAWVNIFKEFAESFGIEADINQLFKMLYNKALEGEADCGGLLSYGYFAGEEIMGVKDGRPLFVRAPESKFTLANFMRMHLYSSCAALRVGMNLLFESEEVVIDKMLGHGGLFKTQGVGQRIMAAATQAPVYVMETAGEGGAWGIALLAAYMTNRKDGEMLDQYLTDQVFDQVEGSRIDPEPEDVIGFEKFTRRYIKGIEIEKAAVDHLIT